MNSSSIAPMIEPIQPAVCSPWPSSVVARNPPTNDSIRGILPKGGTLLRTTNRGNPFSFPSLQEGHPVVVDRSAEVIRNIHELGIDGIIAIGGDGTLRIAQRLCDMGIPMVAVPKTIDNDLAATDYTVSL